MKLIILILIILAVFFVARKINIEGYKSYTEGEKRAIADADKIGGHFTSAANSFGDGFTQETGLDYISTKIANRLKKNKSPEWRDLSGSGIAPDTVTVNKKDDTSLILTDGCSKKSILRSEYEEDICKKYAGDYKTIDSKCKSADKDTCNLLNCCVLLNGEKCVAGSANGPSYLTDQGNTIDYKYYYYKNKCYGDGCNATYQEKCGRYSKNSTNISKECMIQMFNSAGCPNPNPKFIINDDYVYNNSKSSKQYINKDLKETAKNLLKDITLGNDDSRIKCKPNANNPCDQYLSTSKAINKACVIRMINDVGCPNTAPEIPNNQIYNLRTFNKTELTKLVSDHIPKLKSAADSKSDLYSQNFCYGRP